MNVLEEIIRISLIETGIITFLIPSILFMTMVYIFLTRSRIVESKQLAGMFSFLVFLLILVFPIISGIDISVFLSTFFVQFFFLSLIFLIGIIASSIFYPDFLKVLERFQKSRSAVVIMILIGLIVFVTSGFLSFIISTLGGPQTYSYPSSDRTSGLYERIPPSHEISFISTVLVLLIVFAVILVAAGRVIGKEE